MACTDHIQWNLHEWSPPKNIYLPVEATFLTSQSAVGLYISGDLIPLVDFSTIFSQGRQHFVTSSLLSCSKNGLL